MRRRLLALTAVSALLFGVAACGGDTDEPESDSSVEMGDPIAGVTVTGEQGEEPKVDIETPLEVEESQTQVLTAGEGNPVVEGEKALLHIYLANATTGKKAAATFDQGAPADVTVSEDQLFKPVADALVDKPQGSRIVIADTVENIYGSEGAEQLGLGVDDSLVFVVDVMSVQPTDVIDGPEGEEQDAPSGLPSIVEDEGEVSNLDFADAAKKPSDELEVITLIEGEGPEARDDSLVTFDYFGEVYGEKKPFDESFSKEPVTFALGTGGLIKAWDEGLVGLKKGSRVMIVAPADMAYGEAGNPSGGIPKNATLVFVVDILGVDA